MKLAASFFSLLGVIHVLPASAVYTWPSAQIDELEDIMYLQSGYNSRKFSDPITPCSSGLGGGRFTAAEWVRVTFHDTTNYNVTDGTGGVDASIMFETEYAPNIGIAFNSTFQTMQSFYNVRASMADLLALSTYAAVRRCGGPVIPYRAGRIDVSKAGPDTGPLPTDSTQILSSKFAAAGNNVTAMIKLTACGHTFGSVHGVDFPDIVGNSSADYAAHFDSTVDTFDSRIAVEFIHGNTSNPLVVGPSKTNSDQRVYESDGNITMTALMDPKIFSDTCRDTFEHMLNTVANTVTLTDVITPIPVKPSNLQLTLGHDGSVTFSGEIRLLTTGLTSSTTPKKVTLNFTDRDGKTASSYTISTTQKGKANGLDDSFVFYGFSSKLPKAGISKFTVTVTSSNGAQKYDNNGQGFPMQDTVFFQAPQSCLVKSASGNSNLTVVAAARSPNASVNLSVVTKLPQQDPEAPATIAPRLLSVNVSMSAWKKNVGDSGYTLYTKTYSMPTTQASTTFDIFSGSDADNFKKTSALPASCTSF